MEQDGSLDEESLRAKTLSDIEGAYEQKEAVAGVQVLRHFEKAVMLQVLDAHWKEHLAAMDHLRQGIHLRGYAQKNPKQEYKREAFQMFSQMLEEIKRDVIGIVSRVQVRAEEDVEAVERQRRRAAPVEYSHAEAGSSLEDRDQSAAAPGPTVKSPVTRQHPKIGRNSLCPCGSGRKYKQCHGKLV